MKFWRKKFGYVQENIKFLLEILRHLNNTWIFKFMNFNQIQDRIMNEISYAFWEFNEVEFFHVNDGLILQ